jgi:single-stranded-DNA-specific exonuclease
MLTTVDGIAKGSARSTSNFNIYNALKKCEDLLIHFGGHQAAAGLAVELGKLNEFREKFNRIVKESLNDEDLLPEIEIDSRLKFSEITPKFLRVLDQFSPYGPGNMRPVFLAENVEVSGIARIVGTDHLVVCVKQNGSDKVFDCIGFNMGSFCEMMNKTNTFFDIVFTIDKTARDGRIFPQFRVRDVREKINAVKPAVQVEIIEKIKEINEELN